MILRFLTAAIQRLGGRIRGEAPIGLHYPYVCDTSKMYCARAEPRVKTATILKKKHLLDNIRASRSSHPSIISEFETSYAFGSTEPTVITLPRSKDIPSNRKMALKIFLNLLSRQLERGKPVEEGYAKANSTYKDWFTQYGYQQPKVSLESQTNETKEM